MVSVIVCTVFCSVYLMWLQSSVDCFVVHMYESVFITCTESSSRKCGSCLVEEFVWCCLVAPLCHPTRSALWISVSVVLLVKAMDSLKPVVLEPFRKVCSACVTSVEWQNCFANAYSLGLFVYWHSRTNIPSFMSHFMDEERIVSVICIVSIRQHSCSLSRQVLYWSLLRINRKQVKQGSVILACLCAYLFWSFLYRQLLVLTLCMTSQSTSRCKLSVIWSIFFCYATFHLLLQME